MDLSIIIPAYNEEARLGRMLDQYLPYFNARYPGKYEMLVVVNGSHDRTEEIVREYARVHPALRAIVDQRPIGKGGAIMLGLAQAKGQLVGFTDADGSTPPEAFQELVERIGHAGAIIASRWLPGAQVNVRQPFKRRLISRLFNLLVRVLFRLNISDTQCGAKLLRREAVHAILPRLGVTRWAFDVDLLFQLRCADFTIVEIPSTWHDVAGSRLHVVKASFEMVVALVRLRLIYSPFRWVVALYDRYLARYLHPK